ncbi:MAG TPA: response regulator [Myxococcales bacterium]|nr:response regulator [Myxococcales bacterium]
MSLPHLLLVDDSESVLAFEKAALAGHYLVSTAVNGRDALIKVAQLRPAAVLLDLSMPEMDGDEVLAQMQNDAQLASIPVIIVSSEKQRAEACLKGGARAFLAKPIRAQDLLPLVGKVLEEARRAERTGSLAALFVDAGGLEVGLPLDTVVSVLHQASTRPLPLGPGYLCEMLEVHGDTVLVLDLVRRLGLSHRAPIAERKLVVVDCGEQRLALCVDGVRDPEELAREQVLPREAVAGAEHGLLREALIAVARTSRGPVPVIDPRALASARLLRELMKALRGGVAA